QRCMAVDPAARFRTAGDAYAALEKPERRRLAPSRRQILTLAAAAAAGAAGVALYPVGFRFYQKYAHLPEGAVVMLTPVLNSTGETRFDGLTVALQASLGQSAHFNVWNSQRLADVLRSMRADPNSTPDTRTWREIAFREKAPLIVFSTLSRVGSGYALSL